MLRSTVLGAAALAVLAATSVFAAPAKMQAIVQTGIGGPEVLKLQTIDTPKAGPGKVLIKVYAAGVNPVDWKRRVAVMGPPGGPAPKGPQIPGFDVAGVVDSVGTGVTQFKAGDAVFARADGAYAEYALADASDVAKKPAAFTYEQAAGVPVAGVAGYRATTEANIQKGQRVVIIGAAGGTGSTAVQVAKAKGAYIIASAHSSQDAYLKGLGVDEVVAYDKENVAAKIKNADAVINLVDVQAEPALAYLKKGGMLTSIAGSVSDAKCMAAGVTCFTAFGPGYKGATEGETLNALAGLADKGQYKVTVTKTFTLAQAGEAQELNRTGNTTGKIILAVTAQSKNH